MFYDKMAATASRLVVKFGKSITIRRTTAGTFDPVTGTQTGDTTADLTTNGIEQKIDTKLIDGTRIQNGDRMFVFDKTQVPTVEDQIIVNSVPWSIVMVTPVSPAGTDIVYFVQVRK